MESTISAWAEGTLSYCQARGKWSLFSTSTRGAELADREGAASAPTSNRKALQSAIRKRTGLMGRKKREGVRSTDRTERRRAVEDGRERHMWSSCSAAGCLLGGGLLFSGGTAAPRGTYRVVTFVVRLERLEAGRGPCASVLRFPCVLLAFSVLIVRVGPRPLGGVQARRRCYIVAYTAREAGQPSQDERRRSVRDDSRWWLQVKRGPDLVRP